MYINENKFGLVLGSFAGIWHIVWSILVFIGWAQPLINFSLWAHMISLQPVIGPFDISSAVSVVVFAAVIAYITGYIFAKLWNAIHK